MTANQKNVIKHNRLRIKALGETLAGIRALLGATSSELHREAYGKMAEDPPAVENLDEASIALFHACESMEQACGYLEDAAGVKK